MIEQWTHRWWAYHYGPIKDGHGLLVVWRYVYAPMYKAGEMRATPLGKD